LGEKYLVHGAGRGHVQ
jgi:hypothetical protein